MNKYRKTIKYKKLDPRAITPIRQHRYDAGLDLFALESVHVLPGEIKKVGIGIAIALEPDQTGLFWDKSGLAARGLTILGGCIDSGYRGELKVVVTNLGKESIYVSYRNAITQLIIIKTDFPTPLECDFDTETDRGTSGFGSTDTGPTIVGEVRWSPDHRTKIQWSGSEWIPIPDVDEGPMDLRPKVGEIRWSWDQQPMRWSGSEWIPVHG